LNCEIDGLDYYVMLLQQYRTGVHCIDMYHLFLQCVGPCNLLGSVWSMFVYTYTYSFIYDI